jgi:hypothetical protein
LPTRAGIAAVLAILMLSLLLVPSPAGAVEEGRRALWTACEEGHTAGKCEIPRGIAADPVTGHVFVVDQSNARVNEFTAWGVFVKAWGGGVADGTSHQLQTCTTTCFPGFEGEGPGEFAGPQGIAIDSAGDVYVSDRRNRRVQKFNPAGEFLLMFGGGVNKGPLHPGNVCTAANLAEGDACGIGSNGTSPGEFTDLPVGDALAIGPADTVYVGDKERIQKFGSNGVFGSLLPLPEAGQPKSLDVDGAGNLYLAFNQDYTTQFPQKPDVYKLSATTGAVLGKLAVSFPLAIAAGDDGRVYVGAEERTPTRGEVLVFDATGSLVQRFGKGEGFSFPSGIATNTVTAAGDTGVYVANSVFGKSFVKGYYPPPDKWLPPPVAPEIDDQYAVSVNSRSAVVRAAINPNFWADTSYYVEYGTSDCKTSPCAKQPSPPGSQLGAGVVEESVTSGGVPLSGLEPDTTYYFRFVAQSGGGGPVKGVGGSVGLDGTSGTFTTRPLPTPPNTSCANQGLRSGVAAFLPDCRAYEMVSPLDKEDGDIIVNRNIEENFVSLDQAALDGEALTYSAYRAFGDAQASPYVSQYLARRDPAAGWSSHGITPPRQGPSVFLGNEPAGLDVQFKAFSPDLDEGLILYDSTLELAPGAVPGYGNLYRRDNVTDAYEAITRTTPPSLPPKEFIPEVQGVSTDGNHVVFTASDKLTPNAPAGNFRQLYDFHDGELDLVSILPGEVPNTTPSSAGTVNGVHLEGRTNTVARAISADGSRIFWTAFVGNKGPGSLYVRIDGNETVEVSAASAQFWTADPAGTKALFTAGGNLNVFDVDARTTSLVAGGTLGVVGASEDLSRIYFVSTQSLAGGATAGRPNLYLYEEGGPTVFVAELSTVDGTTVTTPRVPSPVNLVPVKHSAAVTPDGEHLVFTSTARVTGYDNTDPDSGEPAMEVYVYDAGSGVVNCVSCNPTGARPVVRDVAVGGNHFQVSGRIPGWASQLYAPRLLAADGSRLFFESADPLSPRDSNGRLDVYEWEVAGAGDCDPADSAFTSLAGGCVNLLSSGNSPIDSQLIDASADGEDVFFTTAESLVSQDPDLIDLYDARVGGGFPSPPAPAPGCEGEACQPPGSPPSDSLPSSATYNGPGDPPKQAKPKPKHHKGKKKKKKKQSRHGKQRQHATPGSGR